MPPTLSTPSAPSAPVAKGPHPSEHTPRGPLAWRLPADDACAPGLLVVDDQEEIRTFLAAALREEGYAVRTAADGIEALWHARTWRPDAVLLDLVMPRMNGWQFVEAFRALAGESVPLVAMSAAGPAARRAAGQLRVEFLPKPLDLSQLCLALAALCPGVHGAHGARPAA